MSSYCSQDKDKRVYDEARVATGSSLGVRPVLYAEPRSIIRCLFWCSYHNCNIWYIWLTPAYLTASSRSTGSRPTVAHRSFASTQPDMQKELNKSLLECRNKWINRSIHPSIWKLTKFLNVRPSLPDPVYLARRAAVSTLRVKFATRNHH